jgi:hypothetical protein
MVRIQLSPAMSLRTIGSGAIAQRIHPQHRNPKGCEHGLTREPAGEKLCREASEWEVVMSVPEGTGIDLGLLSIGIGRLDEPARIRSDFPSVRKLQAAVVGNQRQPPAF